MGRGSEELTAAAKPYVCVRVTDMSEVDVANLRFDFDLTFAAVLMHPDGTIYHRYGGRLPDDASGSLSLGSLARLLLDTLPEHEAYRRAPSPPRSREPMRAIDLPVLQKKIAGGQRIDCVHCHTVNDAEHVAAELAGSWQRHELYVFPDPERIGVTLDTDRQSLVDAVADDSPAQQAGLCSGDELLALGEQRSVRTLSDVQWALHRAPFTATQLVLRYRRDGDEHTATLALADGWKRCTPEDYAWRPYKWTLSPAPGFGGPVLDSAQKQALGIAGQDFALHVGYLVDWGERAHRGRAARAAGLRKGDVVVGFAGKRDFVSFDHFHAWVALMRTAGEDTEIVVLRDGERHLLHYRLPR